MPSVKHKSLVDHCKRDVSQHGTVAARPVCQLDDGDSAIWARQYADRLVYLKAYSDQT